MKKYKQLISQQRYTIFAMLQKGYSQKEIADAVGVSASTISRELKRNRGKRGVYSYKLADEMAQERRERVVNNNAKNPALLRRVNQMLEEDYSPAQISGVLRKEGETISHECIYQYIRRDKANGGTLYKHCRHMLKHRKRYVGANASCKNIPNRRSISERPIEADNKSNPGHWEMDTIVGKDNKGAIVTLTERTTNFLLMMKLKFGKNETETANAVVKLLLPYKNLVKTITTDNGSEFACHELITKKIGAKVYFADPYSSWQKGAIEHANKLIRQYIPKGSSFDEFDDEFIKKVQMKINRRPREKPNFEPPVKAFQNVIKNFPPHYHNSRFFITFAASRRLTAAVWWCVGRDAYIWKWRLLDALSPHSVILAKFNRNREQSNSRCLRVCIIVCTPCRGVHILYISAWASDVARS